MSEWTLGHPTEPGEYWVALLGYDRPFLAYVRPATAWFREALLLVTPGALTTTVQTSSVYAYMHVGRPVWPPDCELPEGALNPMVDRRATQPRLPGSR